MNYGRLIGLVMTGLCLLSAVGYLLVKDYRRSVYFLLAAGINLTVVY